MVPDQAPPQRRGPCTSPACTLTSCLCQTNCSTCIPVSSAWQWVTIPRVPRYHDANGCPSCRSDSTPSSGWRLRKSGLEWAEPRYLTQVCGGELRATSVGAFRSRTSPVSPEIYNALGVPASSLSDPEKTLSSPSFSPRAAFFFSATGGSREPPSRRRS